jgi:RHS repeat-associated protein
VPDARHRKERCLRHRVEGDTSPPNGCCRATCGCCRVTTENKADVEIRALWSAGSSYMAGGRQDRPSKDSRVPHLSRLVFERCGFRVNCMLDLDRFGNRWQQNGPQSFIATFTGNNPASPQNNNRMDGYSYDAAGNLLNDGTHSYTYDAENRLIKVDSGNTATYLYDANGYRVHRTGVTSNSCDATGKQDYIYDLSGHSILVLNSGGGACKYEAFVGNRHLATYGGSMKFSHSDWLGTERVRTTNTGAVCESIASLPFGDGQTTTGGCYHTSPLHFTGKERDAESGLDSFGARYDSSSLGRFMTPDSPSYANHTNPQSWNLYAYAVNNPVSFRDADGHEIVCANNAEQCKKDAAAATANAEAAKRVTTNTTKTKHSFLGIKWTTSKTTIAISGDINSFRNLSTNAAKLADLVTSDKTVTVNYDRSVASEGNTGGFELYGKATSRLQSQGFAQNQTWIDPRRDPSWQWDDDAVDQGIPQSNTGEEFAHEVLGHVWGDLFGGAPAGTKGNQRDSIRAENAVRALDPTRGQKGLESHHGYAEMKNP